jgi:hypothetical protein
MGEVSGRAHPSLTGFSSKAWMAGMKPGDDEKQIAFSESLKMLNTFSVRLSG